MKQAVLYLSVISWFVDTHCISGPETANYRPPTPTDTLEYYWHFPILHTDAAAACPKGFKSTDIWTILVKMANLIWNYPKNQNQQLSIFNLCLDNVSSESNNILQLQLNPT